jgi:hypothetical protein
VLYTLNDYRRHYLFDWLRYRRDEMQARIYAKLGTTLIIDGLIVVDTLSTFLSWAEENLEQAVIWTNWYRKQSTPNVVYHCVLLGSDADLFATRLNWRCI